VGCFPPGGVFPCGVWGLPPSGSFVARCCLLSCLCVLCSLASRRLADLPAYNMVAGCLVLLLQTSAAC